MTEYLLFIDSEASGLPKKWDVPYSRKGNWPYAVQIAWIVFTGDGKEVKHENHYINDDDFEISHSAKKIHGITRELLKSKGESRDQVMKLLADDLYKYEPLVVGHFIELDFHIAAAEFYRTGIDNPLSKFYSFCIMRATTHMVRNPAKKYLRLSDLYQILFNTALPNQHDAIVDARATATCFFELLKRGDINEQKLAQQKTMLQTPVASGNTGCTLVFLFFIAVFLITLFYE